MTSTLSLLSKVKTIKSHLAMMEISAIKSNLRIQFHHVS